ncbi:HTH-type transcriptional activator CmpR [Peptococcaceae bacterium CEB3]|nr:HTH-type transcriptional activator CmpR [Peptococcaceae bacterium CEB3]
MNLHQLKVFYYVAQCLSFSKASEELHISQPAVSVQVRKLEEETGVELIEQIGKKLYLTEPGAQLKGYAEEIFAAERQAENMLADYRGLNTGELIIGTSSTLGTYYVPQLLTEFRRHFPKLEVSFKMGNTEWAEEQILKNQVDMALVERDLAHASDCSMMPFLNDHLVVIAGPDHPFVGQEITAAQLATQPFILREPGSNSRKVFRTLMSQRGLPIQILMELESPEAIKRLVSSGLGLGIASALTLEWEVACGRLKVLRVADFVMERQFAIVWHKDKKPNRASLAFTDFVCCYTSAHQDLLADCECARSPAPDVRKIVQV